MSNGVEVLVKNKETEGKHDQRKFKLINVKPTQNQMSSASLNKSLLSSAVSTVVNRQLMSDIFPSHKLMQHNYIIKTCMTTYTYLTTVVQNKRSAISTFETIVSVVTTESVTNVYATDVFTDFKPTKTKYIEFNTKDASQSDDIYYNDMPKMDKRKDHNDDSFDLIQPSEVNHALCTSSCSCSQDRTEDLKTKYTDKFNSNSEKHVMKTRYSDITNEVKPTRKEPFFEKTQYHPYEYESSSHLAPTDKVVEKYTEVLSDFSNNKDPNSVYSTGLLTNEQAPIQANKISSNKTSDKNKPEKTQNINKNKLVVAELIKLGSLGIKGLSQLAPVVIEKMTGGFMKRQDNANPSSTTTTSTTSTTTLTPVNKVVSYSANKRIDTDVESKQGNFPIYIPVDDMETSESQVSFKNATLHQNFWASDVKHSKSHLVQPKFVHESPLVNGGIPISPGEIITANSDVIVGKPAVGGPLTLGASGMKLQSPVSPPPIDNFVMSSDNYNVKEKPHRVDIRPNSVVKVDDSFDLRPPELPKPKPTNALRSQNTYTSQNIPITNHQITSHVPLSSGSSGAKEKNKAINKVRHNTPMLTNHGRPVFLDYIPSLAKPSHNSQNENNNDHRYTKDSHKDLDFADNSPSSSEIVSSRITTDGYFIPDDQDAVSKPFLVDIQPSKVANVLIPHGSSTALVFAGSSEPHKTGNYVDDPLPYPEPGYFGSFSIDAPHMTNVHNVSPNKNQFFVKPSAHISFGTNVTPSAVREPQIQNDEKLRWNDNKRSKEYNKLPPATSEQETHIQIGPQITVYNPDKFKNNLEFKGKLNGKDVIDKEYENYLAVPPPPPKLHYNQDSYYDKNKPYNQRPIIRNKPVHDMKVHYNIQHPAPSQLTPKVTSEVYFATQMSNGPPTSTYSFKVPQSQSPPISSSNNFNNLQYANSQSNHFSTSILFGAANNSSMKNDERDNMYAVTLNEATNIDYANTNNQANVLGSSITVPLSVNSQNDQMNANIPIGTNFAIRVEDDPAKYETVALHGKRIPSNSYEDHNYVSGEIHKSQKYNQSFDQRLEGSDKSSVALTQDKEKMKPFIITSFNSHANFPMLSEYDSKNVNKNNNIHLLSVSENKKNPVINSVDNTNINTKITLNENNQNDPTVSKVTPNYQTNSHGWYSSILNESNLKNIDVEASTRTAIPLNYDYKQDSLPEFGQKIATAGKPPTNLWDQNKNVNKFKIGKPFSMPNEADKTTASSWTSQTHNSKYIPSVFGPKQPVFDIHFKDESRENTTESDFNLNFKKVTPVFENADEVYDGEEIHENSGDIDGEVSSESVKVPVLSTASEKQNNLNSSVLGKPLPQPSNKFIDFNSGSQTEKPFGPITKAVVESNNMKPIYDEKRPRPFTVKPVIPLDHPLQQPHWQINQLFENSTNISYEDNIDLNIGEEMKKTTNNVDNLNKIHEMTANNNIKMKNDSDIITSIVKIKDKKPLKVKGNEKVTLPTFTISTNLENNDTANEIINLSPPPPTFDNNFKSPSNSDLIMGMSPPPPRPTTKYHQRVPQTVKPSVSIRTPPLHLQFPPKTLNSKTPTHRPVKKPVSHEEVSTYRPNYDIVNKAKRPTFNREQPSSQLLPPPIKMPSKISFAEEVTLEPTIITVPSHSTTNLVIFPTPISSGWLTSSGVGFSSNINFESTPTYTPNSSTTAKTPTKSNKSNITEAESTVDHIYSYEYDTSNEYNANDYGTIESIKPTSSVVNKHINNTDNIYESSYEISQEDITTEKTKVSTSSYKNRTRKPYPTHSEEKKVNTSKHKPYSPKPFAINKPVRNFTRPEPTRQTMPIKKNIRPITSRPHVMYTPSIIESSESVFEDYFIKPTESLRESTMPASLPDVTSVIEKTITSTLTLVKDYSDNKIQPTHHAGNEVKIADDYIPTKTEFKTTIITLTKTLSEPPKTVSSIGFVNLTHTLTVTHTKTSLISKAEGAVTQTLVLTNTQTSTVVDVITEIYTQVQPTTIIETVTKHIPLPQVEPTPVQNIPSATKIALDDVSLSSEESDNFVIRDSEVTENIQKIELEEEKDNDTFFVVMNKSQNGGKSPTINTELETGDYDGITRNEQVNNGVSQVLFGEILLAGTPFLETSNVGHPAGYGKECQPDCKASRNERCQRIDGVMKCVCRPGFARMFPDRPCKPTYTYSVGLALGSQGNQRLVFHESLSNNSSKEYNSLASASYEGLNRMIMQSDLRDVYHGVHITKFRPIDIRGANGEKYQGVMNDFYVQLSDNAHETRLKEVIEKYLRHNNFSLGGTQVHAAEQLLDRLNVSDFDECMSRQFHDCSEHARCFNLRGTYTCSCLEGFADLSVNTMYPGRICSSEAVGCAECNYHGTCFDRESAMICECFKWYSGRTCQVNLKAVLITVTVIGAVVVISVIIFVSKKCCCRKGPAATQTFVIGCMQGMPSLHQANMPSKQRADRRALIVERQDIPDSCSMQNTSLPYIPAKQQRTRSSQKLVPGNPPPHAPPPPPAPAVLIPRARLHHDGRDNISRKKSLEACSEAKLISYLESGATCSNDEMRRKHSVESSYSINKEKSNKQGALVSAGFKVSTTVRPDDTTAKEDRDDNSSVNKTDLEAELSRFDTLRKSYSQEDMSEWTDAERRIGELTLSEARSIGGTLPASTGRAASSTRLTHQEANTMAERDLGSTFLLPHVHLYKPDLTSDVSEFDSL